MTSQVKGIFIYSYHKLRRRPFKHNIKGRVIVGGIPATTETARTMEAPKILILPRIDKVVKSSSSI